MKGKKRERNGRCQSYKALLILELLLNGVCKGKGSSVQQRHRGACCNEGDGEE